MALKVQSVSGGPRDVVFRVADVTFSSSYPANGEPLLPSDFEMSKILFVSSEQSHTSRLQPFFDPANNTLRLVATGASGGSAFTEVTTGTNQSAVTARLLVAGIK